MIFVQPHIMEDGNAHVQTQSEWAKKNESFNPTLEFAQPQEDTPLGALPPSDGRKPGAGVASPLLPLPTWKQTDAPPKAQAVRDNAP